MVPHVSIFSVIFNGTTGSIPQVSIKYYVKWGSESTRGAIQIMPPSRKVLRATDRHLLSNISLDDLKKALYSKLTRDYISDANYQHVQVWDAFDCKTLLPEDVF